MGSAKSLSQREHILGLYAKGVSMLQISQQEGINYGTVKNLIKRYKNEGYKGIIPRYSHCGLTRHFDSERSYRLVRLYKQHHAKWGVSYILLKSRINTLNCLFVAIVFMKDV
jgi:transposase